MQIACSYWLVAAKCVATRSCYNSYIPTVVLIHTHTHTLKYMIRHPPRSLPNVLPTYQQITAASLGKPRSGCLIGGTCVAKNYNPPTTVFDCPCRTTASVCANFRMCVIETYAPTPSMFGAMRAEVIAARIDHVAAYAPPYNDTGLLPLPSSPSSSPPSPSGAASGGDSCWTKNRRLPGHDVYVPSGFSHEGTMQACQAKCDARPDCKGAAFVVRYIGMNFIYDLAQDNCVRTRVYMYHW